MEICLTVFQWTFHYVILKNKSPSNSMWDFLISEREKLHNIVPSTVLDTESTSITKELLGGVVLKNRASNNAHINESPVLSKMNFDPETQRPDEKWK